MTVKISKRPMSINKLISHFPASGMLFQVLAGPKFPKAGPMLPSAETEQPMASMKSIPIADRKILLPNMMII